MKVTNKKANLEYALEKERVEAGVVLSGGEAKAIRTGHADISNAFAKIIGGEVFLVNAHIPIAGATKYDAKRTRKLLLHKKEILFLTTKAKQQNLLLVPMALYTKGHFIKAELALGKGKRKFEKRADIKKKDIERDIAQNFKLR